MVILQFFHRFVYYYRFQGVNVGDGYLLGDLMMLILVLKHNIKVLE